MGDEGPTGLLAPGVSRINGSHLQPCAYGSSCTVTTGMLRLLELPEARFTRGRLGEAKVDSTPMRLQNNRA